MPIEAGHDSVQRTAHGPPGTPVDVLRNCSSLIWSGGGSLPPNRALQTALDPAVFLAAAKAPAAFGEAELERWAAMGKSVQLREAVLSDSEALAKLISAIGYPTDRVQMAQRLSALLAHPDYRTVVAALDDQVVGLIGFQLALRYENSSKYVRILVLATDQSTYGKGVGSALIAEAERFAVAEAAPMLVVNSGLHRETAHRFYLGRGFEKLGYGFYKNFRPNKSFKSIPQHGTAYLKR